MNYFQRLVAPRHSKPTATDDNLNRWYDPGVYTGWRKDMSEKQRRKLALKAHGGDMLSTAQGLQALANVSRDKETCKKARQDAQYFYQQYDKRKR